MCKPVEFLWIEGGGVDVVFESVDLEECPADGGHGIDDLQEIAVTASNTLGHRVIAVNPKMVGSQNEVRRVFVLYLVEIIAHGRQYWNGVAFEFRARNVLVLISDGVHFHVVGLFGGKPRDNT